MRIHDPTVSQIFSGDRRLVIPLFQRPYVWTRELHEVKTSAPLGSVFGCCVSAALEADSLATKRDPHELVFDVCEVRWPGLRDWRGDSMGGLRHDGPPFEVASTAP